MLNKKIKHLAIIVPTSALLIFGFSNCGKPSATNSSASSSSAEGGVSGSTPPPSTPGSSTPPVDQTPLVVSGAAAIMTGDQFYSSMFKLTGMSLPTDQIHYEYQARYAAFPAVSDILQVNAPALLAFTSLAGEVCQTLVTREEAITDGQRIFFNGINFSAGTASISDASYQAIIRGMARSFWTRNENTTELTAFQTFRKDFEMDFSAAEITQKSSSEKLMMATCAAILSSLDSVVF
ncbi:MAG: hypothetical protein ACM3MG_12190 [Bacillota bacterium]